MVESYSHIWNVYWTQGDFENALAQLQKSLDIHLQAFGHEHSIVADSKYRIALLHEQRNEMDTVREFFFKCKMIYSKVHGPGHSKMVQAARQASQCVQESE